MLQRFHQFVSGITVCYRYIQRIKSAEMTEFGLKGTHVMCLFYLRHEKQGLTAAQLCSLCAEDKAAISRTLAELEKQQLVATAPREGRKYRARVVLTEQGSALAEKMDTIIAQWVGIGGDGLTEEERAGFYKGLSLIAANLKEKFEGK